MHIAVRPLISPVFLHSFTFALLLLLPAISNAITFIVDRFNDPFPADVCDAALANDCSLREAVIAANLSPGLDVILILPGIHNLTRIGAGEDAGEIGDLDILEPVLISGAVIDLIYIDAGGDNGSLDSVFHILGGAGTEIDACGRTHYPVLLVCLPASALQQACICPYAPLATP